MAPSTVVVVTLPDGVTEEFGPMLEIGAKALSQGMKQANPDWKVITRTLARGAHLP